MKKALLGFLLLAFPATLPAQDAAKVSVRFLSAKEAAEAIVDDSLEAYFSNFQPMEMIAKTGRPMSPGDLAAQRNECRQRYRDAVKEFGDDEKAAITGACEAIHKGLKEAYPFFAGTPWSFIKIDASIEGGMPHTRGPHVVLPERLSKQFALVRARGTNLANTRLAQTLVHEQCHVLQRAKPDLFADLYTKVWGLIRAKGLPSNPWLDKVQVINPDGPDVGWIFPTKDATPQYWQPLVALRDGVEKPSMPKDFILIGVARDKNGDSYEVRVAKDGKPVIQLLNKVPGWQDVFGHVGENFHPNETFAVMFSTVAMKEHVAESDPGFGAMDEDHYKKFREWCRKNFAKAPERK